MQVADSRRESALTRDQGPWAPRLRRPLRSFPKRRDEVRAGAKESRAAKGVSPLTRYHRWRGQIAWAGALRAALSMIGGGFRGGASCVNPREFEPLGAVWSECDG